MRILVVEDEKELREAIGRRLRAVGNAVDEVDCGSSAHEQLAVYDYAIVILDRMLPDGDSLQHVLHWRKNGITTPILFLTGRDSVQDRIEGLEAGADDYLVKPFAMDELLARVATIARRGPTPTPSVLQIADVEINFGRREVRRKDVLIPLRPKEYALLELFASRRGRVVSRTAIIDACWDEDHEPLSNVEESLVASLRRKLGKPSIIRTVRGTGYLLEEPDCEE